MADLTSLIRVRRYAVEDRQKHLAALYAEAEALNAEKADIEAAITQEEHTLNDTTDIEMLGYFARYVEAAKEKIDTLTAQIQALDTRIDIAKDAMREAFTELKKVEITQANRDSEDSKTTARKDANTLDEIALQTYLKQKKSQD